MYQPKLGHRLGAEFLGTFWLVFAGCGSAMFSAKFMAANSPGDPVQVGIGFLGVALAFGLTVLTMAYAVGSVSGGHFNPAVTIGVAVAKRFDWKDVPAYVVTQVVAGLVAGTCLWGISKGKSGWSPIGNMAANGYGAHSPGGYSMMSALIAEILLTCMFVYIILGATDTRAPEGFAPIAIGLGLTLVHLMLIPVTNASVNPARSTGVAFFNGDGAPAQLWLFWVAPIVGAAIAGATYAAFTGIDRRDEDIEGVVDPDYRGEAVEADRRVATAGEVRGASVPAERVVIDPADRREV